MLLVIHLFLEVLEIVVFLPVSIGSFNCFEELNDHHFTHERVVIVATPSALHFFLFLETAFTFYDVRIFDYVDDSVGVISMLNDERSLLFIKDEPDQIYEKRITESSKNCPGWLDFQLFNLILFCNLSKNW